MIQITRIIDGKAIEIWVIMIVLYPIPIGMQKIQGNSQILERSRIFISEK